MTQAWCPGAEKDGGPAFGQPGAKVAAVCWWLVLGRPSQRQRRGPLLLPLQAEQPQQLLLQMAPVPLEGTPAARLGHSVTPAVPVLLLMLLPP